MRRIIVFITLALALAFVGTAWASTWKTVASKSVSGGYATTTLSATINKPHGIRIRTRDSIGASVYWSMVCSKGTSAVSKNGNYKAGSGIVAHRLTLPFSGHPDSCIIAASAQLNGTGTLRIALQKLVL